MSAYEKDVEGKWPFELFICVRCKRDMNRKSEDGMCVRCRHILREEMDKSHTIGMNMTPFFRGM